MTTNTRYSGWSNQKLGAYFENKVGAALAKIKLETNQGVFFQRFYDTKSAGTFLPEQPADFLAAGPTGAYLVECKASFWKESLAACLSNAVSGGQAANAKLWCRSGPNQHSLFLFFCADAGKVEVWDGELVANTFIKPGARLNREHARLVGDLKTVKNLLKEINQAIRMLKL